MCYVSFVEFQQYISFYQFIFEYNHFLCIMEDSSGKPDNLNIRVEHRIRRNWLAGIGVLAVVVGLSWWLWQGVLHPNFSLDASGSLKIGNQTQKNASDKRQLTTLPANSTQKTGVFYDGIARYSENGRYGFVNKERQVVVAAEYDDADVRFYEKMAWVKKAGKYGFVNLESGSLTIPALYDAVDRFEEGFAQVRRGTESGKVNPEGVAYGIDKPMRDLLKDRYFKSRFAKIGSLKPTDKTGDLMLAKAKTKENQWGFLNEAGEWVVQPEYDEVADFTEGVAWVKKEAKEGFVNAEGELVVPLVYDELLPDNFENGPVRALKGKLYGFVDVKGNRLVAPLYEDAGFFREGLAYVKKNNRYGFVDVTGKLVISLRYDEIQIYDHHYGFNDGKAKMRIGTRQGYVYKDGREWWFD